MFHAQASQSGPHLTPLPLSSKDSREIGIVTLTIKAAVTKMLCATWQRCRVHFMRNVLAHAGKSGRRVVSAFIAAFAQETPEAAST